ncbi:signal peptide containing protein [Babesia caballi]|uniref:Signal peptide containing protein n=1 Tax=Babesia caballi TaxID=5871 RepID=A0AAV4LUZ2_BABCB|nr:signal peptide containing protein [Babesia caballi]
MQHILAFIAGAAVTVAAGVAAEKPDLRSLENEQKMLLHDLQQSRIASVQLKDKLDALQQSKNASTSTLDVKNLVVETEDTPEDSAKSRPAYTAPIIVMLPEEPSEREKWEYALTLRCLGQPNFSPFEQIHNSKMLEMASEFCSALTQTRAAIKGKTVADIQQEIKQTEEELKQTRAELDSLQSTLTALKDDSYADRTKKLHVSHNIKLVKHEIKVLETKHHRLHKRLKAAVLFSTKDASKGDAKRHGGSEDESDDRKEDGAGESEEDGDQDEGPEEGGDEDEGAEDAEGSEEDKD